MRVVGAAIAYLTQILLARWMGIFEYGVFVVVYVWLTILSQLGNLGFSSSVIRFIPEYRAKADLGRLWGIMRASRIAAGGFATVLSAVGVGTIWLFPGLVDSHFVWPIYLGAICLPLFCLTEVQDGIARSFDWPDLAFGPTYLWRPIGILLAMAFAHEAGFPMTAATACGATIVATWATALIQLFVLHTRTTVTVERHPRATDWRTWFAVSLPILLSDGFFALLTSVDVLMVAHFESPHDVAVYYAATKTLALVHFVYYAVRAASGPRYSYSFHAGDRAGLESMVRTSVRWTFWPSVAVSVVVLSFGTPLLSLFGSEFADGVGILTILVLGILARASIGPVESLLTMAGHQTTVAWIFGAVFLANVSLNALLIPFFGLYGASCGMALAMILETLLLFLAVRRHFHLTAFIFRIGPPEGQPS
nr:oligosaccharide flippase family protein [Chthonobacter albigriseus]